MKQYKPRAETILKVVRYLESVGLEVCGQCTDLKTGQQFPSLMTYAPEDVLEYRIMYDRDLLYDEE